MVPAARVLDTSKIWVSLGDGDKLVTNMRSYAIYSDDHGETWQRGKLFRAFTDECQFVELADGAVMIDARQNYGDHRWVGISQDGGEEWSRPRAGQFLTPVATSIERFTLKSAGDDRDRIIWTGPKGPGRQTLVVRVSYDEGQTFANEKVIYGGFAAYSDISHSQRQDRGRALGTGRQQGLSVHHVHSVGSGVLGGPVGTYVRWRENPVFDSGGGVEVGRGFNGACHNMLWTFFWGVQGGPASATAIVTSSRLRAPSSSNQNSYFVTWVHTFGHNHTDFVDASELQRPTGR